ncbi:hypothetical protein TA3x_002899 [Tundrisphaera sp. TA3]|uniref:hypothetical protein n=1 Tax=Tundrisphaera sp. TA3 TaxID=3435775 RepID=UPI003EBC383C
MSPAILVMAGLLSSFGGPAHGQMIPARQITVFGVLATPGGSGADPKLAPVLPQLRRLLPNHGFKLIKIESQRAMAGQSVACDLGDGFVASAQLVEALDLNGKVQMRFNLAQQGASQFQTVVTTPPDQVMFCDKMLPNGSRLLIGLGAR